MGHTLSFPTINIKSSCIGSSKCCSDGNYDEISYSRKFIKKKSFFSSYISLSSFQNAKNN